MSVSRAATADRVHAFILENSPNPPRPDRFPSDPFWKGLQERGSELWLDTGDIEGAARLWTPEFSGLTTNNTLLNKEVQKGTYDELIDRAGRLLTGMPREERVRRIAFILNAVHGRILAGRFGARVSVEQHTDLAHDIEGAVEAAREFHRIEPDSFIVKIPFTPAGLIATRRVRELGIPVNMTLGFSARQNTVAALFAFPSFVNVFLGRVGSYVADNGLGGGEGVGEAAALASQAQMRHIGKELSLKVRQIAASIRSAGQLPALAGVDVLTIPLEAAEAARREPPDLPPADAGGPVRPPAFPEELRLSVLWEVTDRERELAEALVAAQPRTEEELVRLAREGGVPDLFPRFAPEDLERIAGDGKIPRHARWAERIAAGELAADSLLNEAGLASFAHAQRELDGRIERRLAGGG